MANSIPELNESADFVLNNERHTITLEIHGSPAYVSFVGESGQNSKAIREALGDIAHDYRDELVEILDAWDATHLRPVTELTDDETDMLRELPRTFLLVNGERYGTPGDLEDLDDADFSHADDTIDSRDVIKRIEELEGAFEAAGLDWAKLIPSAADYDAQGQEEGGEAETRAEELKALKDLEGEASGYASDWNHGETLIRESYFRDYAEQFAEDIGAINADAAWPNNCIDWDKAAGELKSDYTEVDFDGVAYLIR